MVYAAPRYAQSKYSDVRGYVKVNLTKPLRNYVEVGVEDIGNYKIDMKFQTLLDACFYCKEHDHLICDYMALKEVEKEE